MKTKVFHWKESPGWGDAGKSSMEALFQGHTFQVNKNHNKVQFMPKDQIDHWCIPVALKAQGQ